MPRYEFSCHVEPQYLPEESDCSEPMHAFAYTVTLTNIGDIAAQLIARHWTIVDARGFREDIQGLGVVGQQPLLKPGQSFEYTSGARLRTASGTMHGSYFFVAVDGSRFEVSIPMFVLEAEGAAPSTASTTADGSPVVPVSTGRVLH